MKLILFIHICDIILYINYVFFFVQVRTVAMATFSFLWLYLANSQVGVYMTIGPLGFTEMFIEKSSMFHITFVQIA